MTVDYREYAYAGTIPADSSSARARRQRGSPDQPADRSTDSPLFPSGWRYETQIIALLLSADTENDADVLAITGASAALAISEIPFEKTVAGVRVGMVNNEYNPTYAERKQSALDLIVAGTRDGIVMVEAGAKEVSEAQVVGALEAAHAAIKKIVAGIEDPAAGKKKVGVESTTIAPSSISRSRRRCSAR